MRVAVTGTSANWPPPALSKRAAPGVTIVALGRLEFASAYGFSSPERTKSLRDCVERLLDVPRRLES